MIYHNICVVIILDNFVTIILPRQNKSGTVVRALAEYPHNSADREGSLVAGLNHPFLTAIYALPPIRTRRKAAPVGLWPQQSRTRKKHRQNLQLYIIVGLYDDGPISMSGI